MIEAPHRAATPDDAGALAEFVNMAGEGLPHYLWSRLAAPGQDAGDVGRERARRESGSFSFRNAIVRERSKPKGRNPAMPGFGSREPDPASPYSGAGRA